MITLLIFCFQRNKSCISTNPAMLSRIGFFSTETLVFDTKPVTGF